jgi:hypothetical protein
MRKRNQSTKTWLTLLVGVCGASVGCASEGAKTNGETSAVTGMPTGTTTGPTSTNTPTTTTPATTGPTPTTTGATSTNPNGPTGATGGPTGGTGNTGETGNTGDSGGSDTTGGGETNGPGPDTTSEGPGGSVTEPAGSNTGAEPEPTSGGEDTGFGEDIPGECTASQGAGQNATGSGPHDVVIETNSADGIRCGTIYRPADLGGSERYPIFVWGEGGCSQDGLSNRAAMAEIASWGYFVVADGTPGSQNACQGGQSGEALLDYITWAAEENNKPCSAYYHSLQTNKMAADGFSCGGLMAENVAGDPRFTAIGITSSGLMGANNNLWDSMHAPFKIMNGGSSDVAYENGLNDYDAISSRGIPILYFSKTSAGHGGDLGQGRGDFNLVNLAWLNWQLKGDEGATGKAFLIGPTCEFCNDGGWEFKSANIE